MIATVTQKMKIHLVMVKSSVKNPQSNTIFHSNIPLPSRKTSLFFMPFTAYLMISKTSNTEPVQATFPHPQALHRQSKG